MRIPVHLNWKRTWHCLNEAQLAAYADGSQPDSERSCAEKHLSRCLSCRDNVAVLLRSEREATTAVPPSWIARVRHLGEPRGAQVVMRWAWASALACLLIFVMGITLASRLRPRDTIALSRSLPTPPVSTSSGPTAERDEVRKLTKPAVGPIVITPADDASIGRDLEVRWQPLASAVNYEVRVLDAAGDTVWSTQTNAEHLQIPADALQRGRKYFVLISASLPTGKTVHARAVSFKVEAKQEIR